MAVIVVVGLLIDILILKIIKKSIIKSIVSDLQIFFNDQKELYLPNFKFIVNVKRFRIFSQAIKESGMDINIEGDYLKKA
jgi:hypothetical protein